MNDSYNLGVTKNFTMKMTKKQSWIPACAGMTEEGHLDFYFHEYKKSFLRKKESINYSFHSWEWAKFTYESLVNNL